MSAATEQQRSRKSSIDPAFEPYNVPQTPPPRPLGTRGSAGRLSTIKRLGTSAGPLKGTSGQRSPQPSLKEEPSLVDKSVTGATTPAVPLADEDIVPPLWFKLKTIPPVLIAAVLGGAFIGYLGWSVLWLGLILYLLSAFAYGEIERLRGVLRAEAHKESMMLILSSQSESVEWLNHILERFWIVYSPDLCKSIASSVDLVLEASKPGFLDSLKLPVFTLGSSAPSFANAHVYPGLESDLIHLDLDLLFQPRMAEEKDATTGANIQLVATLVKVDLPISVRDIQFRGKMRLALKLIPKHPYIKAVDFTFLAPPSLSFILKPLIPVNVMDIPVFQDFLQNLIQSALAGFVSPNTFSMDIERMMDPDLTAKVAAGVARVTVKQARDLPNMEALGSLFNQNNVSDPFVRVCLDDGEIVATTKVIDDSLSPIWNETFFVIIPPSNEKLTFQVFHESAIGPQFIGQISEPIQNEKIDGWFDLLNKSGDKKVKGQIRCQIEFFNRIDESVLEVIEGASQANLEAPTPSVLNRGILNFNILEAKDISMFPSVCPKVVCFVNKKEQFTTSIKKTTTKPGWNETKEVFVENFDSDVVELQVVDTKNSTILGSIEFLATEVREMGPSSSEWHELDIPEGMEQKGPAFKGFKVAVPSLKFNAAFYPVDMRGVGMHELPDLPGILEIQLLKASDLEAVNLDGKTSDPFFTIELNNKAIFQTEEYDKNLNPSLTKEPIVGVLMSAKELDTLKVVVADFQNIGKHRPMGSAFFDLHKLVQMEEDGSLICPFQKSYLDVTANVVMEGEPAGNVYFKIRFRTISKEKEVSLRKRKEGNIVEADVALGIDAKKLVILSEESTIGVNKSFLASAKTKILPTSIFNQEKAKATRLSKLIEDGSPKGKLEITLIRATDLPAVNRNDDTSDPYLTIELNGHQIYKSHVYKEQLNPEFTEDGMILHPVSLQYIIQSERVVFRVKDYNKILANKFLGEASLNISNLLEFEPDTQPSKPGCKFKTPDGIQCVLKNIKTWEGPLQLVNNEQPSGQLYVKVTMHFKDFTPNWTPLRENIEEQPSVAAGENRTVEVESSNRKLNISCVANFNVLQDKLYTIPSFQLKEKANYVMTISQKSGDVIYKSSPLKQKDHFSKLFPLEVRFSLQSAEENFIDSLLLSFDDPSGVSTGQVYSIPFSKESAKDVQLTEWLSVNLSTSVLPVTAVQSVESMRSLGSSASLETTASKKKSLFNFRKRK